MRICLVLALACLAGCGGGTEVVYQGERLAIDLNRPRWFTGRVKSIEPSASYSGPATLADHDPLWVVTVVPLKAADGGFPVELFGGEARLAIHSPTKEFARQHTDIVGRVFHFAVSPISGENRLRISASPAAEFK